MRRYKTSDLFLLFDWLLRRGPRAVFLRLFSQTVRIATGRPVYRYSQITPQIYIGGQHRRYGWEDMTAQGITAVVNMRHSDDVKRGVASERYLHLPTTDNTPPSLEHLRQGVDFIADEIARGGVVYVHCGVGVGRAPTMVAAYLISTGMTSAQAWQLIRKTRPFIWPMRWQVKQVEKFAESLTVRE
jgi:protein-tyrosine phosphatase